MNVRPRGRRGRFGKVLVAAGLAVAVVVAAPVVQADTRLALNGAAPLPEPLNSVLGGLTPAEYAALTPQVGANWLPGTSPVVVDYPATVGPLWGLDAPTGDQSIDIGQANLHAAIVEHTVWDRASRISILETDKDLEEAENWQPPI